MAKEAVKAVGYMRTSSAANVGGDSDKRQRIAIEGFARANGYKIVDWYYDAAVSGADDVNDRPGFMEMLNRVASNGAKTIIVESPDRFARDLLVQLTGHKMLAAMGIALVPATAPDFFTQDTPTAVLIRQILGAIAEFDKATTVAKLAAARKRKKAATGRCEGRKPLTVTNPDAVARALELRRADRSISLRKISDDLATRGFINERGQPFNHKSIASMLAA